MVPRAIRGSKRKKAKKTDLKEYPKPPEEHAYELKMEKSLKRMLDEQKKDKVEKKSS